ncbi:MAG: glutathione S-transferase N-terminal domain-containing protein [Steroidobacteraceae bacterium]
MIDLYYWPTPNGQKVTIVLEELALPYRLRPVNILRGEQFSQRFLRLSPNNKIPAIVDTESLAGGRLAVFESGAILQYLADKTGRLLSRSPRQRYNTLQWLNFQVASVGPMFGQCGHFLGYAPKRIPYAIKRYRNETLRLYGVMDRRLRHRRYLADDYSIADIAVYPWVDVRWLHRIELGEFANVKRWFERIGERPAVRRGMAVMAEHTRIGNPDRRTREAFFGRSQLQQGQGR